MTDPTPIGDPFAVAVPLPPGGGQVIVYYDHTPFAPITAEYARTFASALLRAADRAEEAGDG